VSRRRGIGRDGPDEQTEQVGRLQGRVKGQEMLRWKDVDRTSRRWRKTGSLGRPSNNRLVDPGRPHYDQGRTIRRARAHRPASLLHHLKFCIHLYGLDGTTDYPRSTSSCRPFERSESPSREISSLVLRRPTRAKARTSAATETEGPSNIDFPNSSSGR
jgi:hypothetical protein